MTSKIRYRIEPVDPAAHLFEVCVTVAQPSPDGQVFSMPAWIPGSYMIRDYARNVVAIRAESDGREVELAKLDKSRWRAGVVSRPLTLIARIFAYDLSVRGAHLDTTHAYFNGPCVFFTVAGQEDAACELEILPPDESVATDWRVATSMRRKGAEAYGFGTYEASDYAELIDHPVEIGHLSIGEFEVNGIPHGIAIRGRVRVDMGRLCHDLQTLCEQHVSLLGIPDDMDRYLFLLHAPGSGYGGLEHRWSSSLVCARDSLPARGDDVVGEAYRTFLGLASHEYFHSWNVKRMKPAAFTPYDLSTESYTELLWVFEGVTSYYDDLALVRSGLINEASYLELLGQTITRVLRGGGRLHQSVAESSFDAWTKFYRQDANATNAIVSYYAKGALIALALDLKLRVESEGRVSLDDAMKTCWERWGETGTGMPEDGFEAVASEVSGIDLGDFFDAMVRGTGELPLEQLLQTHGIDYHLRASRGKGDKGGTKSSASKVRKVWLGAKISDSNGRPVFVSVANGGPAENAGVAPGDEAVALDGLRVTSANVERRLRSCHEGDELELIVFRGDELLTTIIRIEAAPNDTCYLELRDDVELAIENRRIAWLHA
ncbi:MAG: M61 family metallopeptidase [Woeseiaceae bacterium]